MTISRTTRLLLLAGALVTLGAACGLTSKESNTNEAVNATVNTIVNRLPNSNSVTTGTFSTTPTNQ